jgi:hypothetical protein
MQTPLASRFQRLWPFGENGSDNGSSRTRSEYSGGFAPGSDAEQMESSFADDIWGEENGDADIPPDSSAAADPVHDVLKRLDKGFGLAVHFLEKEAREMAVRHAEKGLPRHDKAREKPLQSEKVLEQRSKEILLGWIDRAGRKLQGALEAETGRAGAIISSARPLVSGAETAKKEFDEAARDMRRRVPAMDTYPRRSPEKSATVPAEGNQDGQGTRGDEGNPL